MANLIMIDGKSYGGGLDSQWKLECDNAQNLLSNNAVTKTVNGVTFTVNDDGSVTVNGTATDNADIIFNNTIKLPIGTYIMSGCSGGSYETYRFFWVVSNGSGTVVDNVQLTSPTVYTNTSNSNVHNFGCWIKKGTVVDTVIYPMLEKGTVAHPYKPYKDSYVTNEKLENNNSSYTRISSNNIGNELVINFSDGINIIKKNGWVKINVYGTPTATIPNNQNTQFYTLPEGYRPIITEEGSGFTIANNKAARPIGIAAYPNGIVNIANWSGTDITTEYVILELAYPCK